MYDFAHRGPEPAPMPEACREPTAAASVADSQDQLQASQAASWRANMLGQALGSVGGNSLSADHADQLGALRGQLGTAQALLAAGDIEGATAMIASLDGDAGALVQSSGTVVDIASSKPGAQGNTFDGISTMYVNGMSQTLTDGMAAGQMLADARGTNVGLVYNKSDGFGPDLGESVVQKLQHLVPGYEHRTKEGGTLAKAAGARMDAGDQVDIVTHSQGANFAKEAVERLDDDRSAKSLDEKLHLTLMGAPLDADELPDHFDNTTFLDEKDDPVSGHLGRRDASEVDDRKWWEKLPVIGRDRPQDGPGDQRVISFDDPDRGALSGAHDPATYLSHPDALAALTANPFDRR